MEIASCAQAAMHAPQSMHFSLSKLTIFPRVSASVGQASTHPLQAVEDLLPHLQLTHFPSFQQHFL
jgi:hypothetical protein